jgi:hypothetical protein
MLDQFLNEVVISIVGKSGEKLASIINSKKHVMSLILQRKWT